ncbi:MAG: glycogen/starch synthase [Bacteroidaceae bacterium]|nr:glycogen/starch synthase [Bacteroidaceae bacterium]
MTKTKLVPSVIFETSWEVCNKVGGIYTVLSSRAKTLQESHADKVFFIGPDIWQDKENAMFKENKRLLTKWKKAASEAGINVRIGRWNVPGQPIALLVDFQPFFEMKNEIYAEAWNDFQVDSLHAYGDYDEASMFSYAAGKLVEVLIKADLLKDESIVYQAHEWMSGLGMLFLKKACPEVATIFTTHATSIGRSIAGNNKLLYKYFGGYNGDQMAAELSMEAKHSIEKQSAHGADCFTTVSTFTDRECKQLLDKPADVVLPNGFENDFVPQGAAFTKKRKEARKCILDVASNLIGEQLADDTLIVSTSGRNDFRCKGFDVYLEALAQLNARMKDAADSDENVESNKVLALIEVPCWTKEPRKDLADRLAAKAKTVGDSLPTPMITHDLYNINEDRILCLIKNLGLWNTKNDPVKVILVPCYLEGNDGIFNMPYYDLLTANDLCLYPSYYEPWGYTPLESCAFKAPCITTDLSGFGQWVNDVLGYQGELSDGVKVIHRDDDNYFEVAREICEAIEAMTQMPKAARTNICKKAAALADKAQWKNFIKHYFEAYDFALRNK